MIRYTAQLLGLTIFALTLIWFAGPGDASQTSSATEGILWADTIHITTNDESAEKQVTPDDRDTFMKNIRKLEAAAFRIRNNYMEDVDYEKIIKAGIRGLLDDLDRFSILMERSSYDALMESTHGKYEGLGMQIDSRDNNIVIVTPMEGTPAERRGLRAGDVILQINDKPTDGMTTSDASKLMRGKAGTSVRLLIQRRGVTEPIEFEIERAVIELKSVNYSGTIPGTDIGYVRLSKFAEESSQELRTAISALNDKNISALVFDLRSNGGGLLDQAKETAELFLKKGSEIVYTKGRKNASERHFRSDRPPLLQLDKPLVILVDEGTASASEIVAGAVQDWDRGLIIGSATYGKGLVQQIFPISNDGSLNLKLTTAKYYVPSGRCIQRSDRQEKRSHSNLSTDDESSDSLVTSDKPVFYTNGGRIVYGGGGIVPDIEVERDTYKTIEINLERQSLFFDFAIKYVAEHPEVKPNLQITDDILSDFRAFLTEKEFSYKTALQMGLEDLRETVRDEDKETLFSDAIAKLETLVEGEKDEDFEKSREYIARSIRREIVRSIAGERGVYEQVILRTDKTIAEAVRILSTSGEYNKLMETGQKKAEL